jgi:hypothetical protein
MALGEEPARETPPSRIRAWTTSALRDLVYAGAVYLWSIAAFTILVTERVGDRLAPHPRHRGRTWPGSG